MARVGVRIRVLPPRYDLSIYSCRFVYSCHSCSFLEGVAGKGEPTGHLRYVWCQNWGSDTSMFPQMPSLTTRKDGIGFFLACLSHGQAETLHLCSKKRANKKAT